MGVSSAVFNEIMCVSNENLGISNEMLWVSNEILEYKMKIWGFLTKIWVLHQNNRGFSIGNIENPNDYMEITNKKTWGFQ